MASPTQQSKWEARYRNTVISDPRPAEVLHRYRHLLPSKGTALDLAAGLGGNALFLARHGLRTSAWDISANAMQALDKHAKHAGLTIRCETRDVVSSPPAPASYDVIVISRFLERSLCPAISQALAPGGLLFYQTFTHEKTSPEIGPRNPDYLLEQNELLTLFNRLIVRAYHEEGTLGELTQGTRNEALLVAQQPI